MKLECTALGEHQQLCSVGYPVFRSMAKVGAGTPQSPPQRPPPPPPEPFTPPPQVLFTLEFEFSCSVLLNQVEVALEATR